MDELIKNLDTYMLIGVVAIIGISQFNRKLGSILGIFFWAAVAYVGHLTFTRGGGIGIASLALSPTVFYTICGVLIVVNIGNGLFVVRRKRRAFSEASRFDEPS